MDDFRRRVARLVMREEFDLIHAHDWVTFPAAMEAARAAGLPWAAHFHSTEGERHPGRPDPVVEHLEREAARSAGVVIAPSKSTAKRLAEIYGADAARIQTVPNSLSPEEVALADMGGFETRRVVFLGRLARQKGPDLYARIAEEVLKTRPNVTFVAHGEGEEAGALSRSPVRVLGPVDWRGRGSAFRGASAIVVPSRAEPFGMVILEAMQHNVPVLYAAGSGAAEVLDSGVPIKPEDAAGSAALLVHLLDDWLAWERTVEAQSREIRAYPKRGYERELVSIWTGLVGAAGATSASPAGS
jgi:glycosyltransferase involved in cell wall biosynthesis